MLPAADTCGFVESDVAKAAFGRSLVRDVPVPWQGSFGLCDHVTFAVRRGPVGQEAVDMKAQR